MSNTRQMLFQLRRPANLYIRLNAWLLPRLPASLRNIRPMRLYGNFLHRLVRLHAQRRQFSGTFFLRNRPMLGLMRRLSDQKPMNAELRIAVLGCSIGAEVYSILFMIRSARPDLDVKLCAVDNSASVLNIARSAVYGTRTSQLIGSPIFERMTNAEFTEMFEGDTGEASVRAPLREGITWHLRDAGDPEIESALGPQDFVVASNFLCHMEPSAAEHCLRNIARLAQPSGHLFVSGVDLDVRAKVARELHWQPVLDLIEEIHDGDLSVRRDWPYKWWGLEPLNVDMKDWQTRYAAVFRVDKIS
jgi:SAM-dependent methyltransferase